MLLTEFFSILTGIVLVAGLATLVRKDSATADVLKAASDGFVNAVQAATGATAK